VERPAGLPRTRATGPAEGRALDLLEPNSAVGGRPSFLSAGSTRALAGLLWAGAGWRVRVDGGWLGRALSILVPAITCGWGRRALWDVKTTEVVVAAPGEASVEVVLPEGPSCGQLCCSGWPWVVGVDAVGGPPHGDFTNDDEVRAAPRRRPHRLGFVLADVTSDPIAEVGH
jgi:hypothetical protein